MARPEPSINLISSEDEEQSATPNPETEYEVGEEEDEDQIYELQDYLDDDTGDEPTDAHLIVDYIPRGSRLVRRAHTFQNAHGQDEQIDVVESVNDIFITAAHRTIIEAINEGERWDPEKIVENLLVQEPFCWLPEKKVRDRVLRVWKDLTGKVKRGERFAKKTGQGSPGSGPPPRKSRTAELMESWLDRVEGLLTMLDGMESERKPVRDSQPRVEGIKKNKGPGVADARRIGSSDGGGSGEGRSQARGSSPSGASGASLARGLLMKPKREAKGKQIMDKKEAIKLANQIRQQAAYGGNKKSKKRTRSPTPTSSSEDEQPKSRNKKSKKRTRSPSPTSSEDEQPKPKKKRNKKLTKGSDDGDDSDGFPIKDMMQAMKESLHLQGIDQQLRARELALREGSGTSPGSSGDGGSPGGGSLGVAGGSGTSSGVPGGSGVAGGSGTSSGVPGGSSARPAVAVDPSVEQRLSTLEAVMLDIRRLLQEKNAHDEEKTKKRE